MVFSFSPVLAEKSKERKFLRNQKPDKIDTFSEIKKNQTYLFELSPDCENTVMISTNHANSSQKSDVFTN
jgi:hypothetical protein